MLYKTSIYNPSLWPQGNCGTKLKGMTELEFKALEDKIGTSIAAKVKEAAAPLQQKLDTLEQKLNEPNLTAEAKAAVVKEIQDAVKASDDALRAILTKQGEDIAELRQKIDSDDNTAKSEESVIKVLESQGKEIARVFGAKTGQVTIQLGYKADKHGNYVLVAKAADVHNTTTTGANASITQDVSDAAILRIGSDADAIETQQRDRPWILDFVSVGTTTVSALTWFDEVPKQGDFAVTNEGATKPLVMYTFNRTSSDYKKATGRAKLTEEFNNDFPRLVSTIKDLMKVDCRNEMNDIILADMVAAASTYSNADLVGTIDNADNYAAIAAVAGQLGNHFYTPNVLVMNNNQGIVTAAQKDTTGQYIDPQMLLKEINATGLQIIKHPSVAFGNFFLGDGSVYKVLLKGDLIVRIGYSNDDFDKNQYSMVVEQFFYSYISQARKAGLVYASFEAVKALIEEP